MNTQSPRFRIVTAAEVESIACAAAPISKLATACEVERLTALHRRISALRQAYFSLIPAQWNKETEEARMKFRENPSLEAIADLCNRYHTDPVRHMSTICHDIIIAACNVFEREAKPLLIAVLNRGAENLAAEIQELKALEAEWKQSSAGLFTGEIQSSAARQCAEKKAAKITACLARLSPKQTGGTTDFPPEIPSVLKIAGLELPDPGSNASAAPEAGSSNASAGTEAGSNASAVLEADRTFSGAGKESDT